MILAITTITINMENNVSRNSVILIGNSNKIRPRMMATTIGQPKVLGCAYCCSSRNVSTKKQMDSAQAAAYKL